MRSKETPQVEMSASERFFSLYKEVEQYLEQIESHGRHSFHGKFYWRVVKEKQNEMITIIDAVLQDSGQFDMTFTDLVESVAQGRVHISPAMVMYDLLEAGEYQLNGKLIFEDVVVIGMVSMGGF